MKKKMTVIISSALAAFILVAALCAVLHFLKKSPSEPQPQQDTQVPITQDPTDEDDIKKAFFDVYFPNGHDTYTYEDIKLSVYGRFEDKDTWVVLIFPPDVNYISGVTTEDVGKWRFTYAYTKALSVYSGGMFYPMTYAYENGILTDEQLDAVGKAYSLAEYYGGLSFLDEIRKRSTHTYAFQPSYSSFLPVALDYKDVKLKTYLSNEEDEFWAGRIENAYREFKLSEPLTVGEWNFVYSSYGMGIDAVYLRGEFFDVETAYKNGIINDGQLDIIAVSCKCAYKKEIIDEAFIKERTVKIQKAYFEIFCKDQTFTYENIGVEYYGQFSHAAVMFVHAPNISYAQRESYDVVGSFRFVYYTAQKLLVYHEGKFYSLKQAYEKGILNDMDLSCVSSNYESRVDLYTPLLNSSSSGIIYPLE